MKTQFIIIIVFAISINAQDTNNVNAKKIKDFLITEYHKYELECLNDTIYAKRYPEMFEFNIEFLFKYINGTSRLRYIDEHGKRIYTTDLKLIKRGYNLARIIYLNEDDHTLGYIWIYVMQPNFNGFVKWLRGDMPTGKELDK